MRYFLLITVLVSLFVISSLSFALTAGDKAPLFEAPSTQGKISLAEFQGKKHVVLALYFADFTRV
jgi:peroxiredoxin Q/BCP